MYELQLLVEVFVFACGMFVALPSRAMDTGSASLGGLVLLWIGRVWAGECRWIGRKDRVPLPNLRGDYLTAAVCANACLTTVSSGQQ